MDIFVRGVRPHFIAFFATHLACWLFVPENHSIPYFLPTLFSPQCIAMVQEYADATFAWIFDQPGGNELESFVIDESLVANVERIAIRSADPRHLQISPGLEINDLVCEIALDIFL